MKQSDILKRAISRLIDLGNEALKINNNVKANEIGDEVKILTVILFGLERKGKVY